MTLDAPRVRPVDPVDPAGREEARIGVAVAAADGPRSMLERYRAVRAFTERLCEPLVTEDYVIQSMPDVSPTKWHLAHTSWFFETFALASADPDYRPLDPMYNYLFNSYYNTIGYRHCRPKRGLVSRPTVDEVYAYRAHVDEHMTALLQTVVGSAWAELEPIMEIGLHHEQQHQELMVTDIKHVFSENPLFPAYRARDRAAGEVGGEARGAGEVGGVDRASGDFGGDVRAAGDVEGAAHAASAPPLGWIEFKEDVHAIGHAGDGFAFDNESPRHRVLTPSFALATRLVTAGEYLAFIEDGGYERPDLWLSAGWDAAQREGWRAPLYWQDHDDGWRLFTLAGVERIDPAAPVCHVSYFEADAYARWKGARLPTEFEWEVAVGDTPVQGNFAGSGRLHPAPAPAGAGDRPAQLFGDVWEWTRSDYAPYPGYRPAEGAIGEYNGKFMSGQYVLRGGSCATSVDHIRATYRNFFPPDARWQFSGIRLAKDPV